MVKHYDETAREEQNGLLPNMERVFTNRKCQSELFKSAIVSSC